MILTALALALANPALDAFDEANLSLTGCGFAAHRQAAAAGEDLERFKRSLGDRCAGEVAKMRRAITALEISRGKGPAAARSRADRVIAQFHSQFAEQYARRQQDEAKLEALVEAFEREREANAE